MHTHQVKGEVAEDREGQDRPSGFLAEFCLHHQGVRGALQIPAQQWLLDDWVALYDTCRSYVKTISLCPCWEADLRRQSFLFCS